MNNILEPQPEPMKAVIAFGRIAKVIMMLGPDIEPELMVKMCDHICVGLGAVLELFENWPS